MNPHVHIIIRTRYVNEMADLYKLGADEVIPEEFETSIEIFTRVMAKYLIPHKEIEKLVSQVRSDGYELFRSLSISDTNYGSLAVKVPEIAINTIHVCSNSKIVGQKLGTVDFDKNFSLTLLAISRANQTFSKPDRDFVFEVNDILFFLASSDKLLKTAELFRSPEGDCGFEPVEASA
jgi:CPA2 family monovalent cation:H+ antiporter-2